VLTDTALSEHWDHPGRFAWGDTLCALFQRSAAEDPTAVALSTTGASLTWGQYADRTAILAAGWGAIGLKRGDAVAMLVDGSPDFHVMDTSILRARGVPFSLSAGDPAERLGLLLRLSEAKFVVAGPGREAIARAAIKVAGMQGIRLVVLDPAAGLAGTGGDMAVDDVREAGEGAPAPDAGDTDPHDIATLIFTSGTTGTPKGVRLSHRAVASSLAATHAIAPIGVGGEVLSFLPMSHIAERFMSHYQGIAFRLTVHSVPDAARLYDEIRRVRPSRFFAVPRVYEKLAAAAHRFIDADPALVSIFKDSLDQVRREQSGDRGFAGDQQSDRLAALAPVREALGLEGTEYRGVATAPSSPEILELFSAIGLPVGNIWGMSEAIMCTMNPPDRLKLSTVGVFLDGVEGHIAEDGEVLVRGRNLFSGYLPGPDVPDDPIDAEGWLHTGDLGTIDGEGYLSITGRKKELMVTATGANIAPAHVEGALIGATDLVGHVLAVADGRRYVTVVVGLDEDALRDFAADHGLRGGFAELSRDPTVHCEVSRAVERANSQLPRAATIRGFVIAEGPWIPGGPELTPTMKLRRQAVLDRYAAQVDALYTSQ
jgi:long-chain acyl-CoA synthetase